MSNNKVGIYPFIADPFHVDFQGKLFLGVLGNHLLNCAEYHATERSFGMGQLNEAGYTWVLSRLAIEMDEMPREFEEFRVSTWIENVYRLFTDRNFCIQAGDGRTLGYARSIWAMIDKNTRKPVDLLSMNEGRIVDYIDTETPCPISKHGRIKMGITMPSRSLEVNYSDIDINGHVNSIKYIDHVLDLFAPAWHAAHRLKRFEIAYVAETYAGDTLSFYKEEVEDGTFHVEVRKNVSSSTPKGEVVCRSLLIFDNK